MAAEQDKYLAVLKASYDYEPQADAEDAVTQQKSPPIAQMQYPSYSEMPVDPQIMSAQYQWGSTGAQVLHNHVDGDAMQIDGITGDMQVGSRPHLTTMNVGDDGVDARLRRELEAQMQDRQRS